MKIVNLYAENFKRLKAIEIIPEGDAVVISGQNDAGKSSVLDSIMAALGGGKIPQPIRQGEKRAEVRLDLGDLKVRRIWYEGDKPRIEVTSADGSKFSSPQAILDNIVGKLAFDPLEFARMAPRDQRATLISLIGLPFDIDDHERKRAELVTEKTRLEREGKQLTSAQLPEIPEGTPDEETSASTLLEELRELNEVKANNAEQRRHLKQTKEDRGKLSAGLIRIREEVKKLQDEADRLAAEILACDDIIASSDADKLIDPDTTELEQRINSVDEINRAVRLKHDTAAHTERVKQARAEWEAARDALNAHDQVKLDALAAAKFPIDGLSFSEDGVLLNGLPFAQASESQRIMASTAMGMAMNPRLRVMFVRDGSLLDDNRLRGMAEMARENEFQLWVERILPGDMPHIEIEDGAVKEIG